MDWKILSLDNGASVVYKLKKECYSVSMGIFIRSGVRYETGEYSGISHFVEHLLFKGTQNRSARELKETIEGRGGSFNAFTAEELVCYHVKILQQHTETAIEILTDMIKNPLFNPEDIDKERNVILEEINMYMDIPARYVYELLDAIMFTNHPLGTSGLGTPETLKKINRQVLLSHTENFHTGKNIILGVTGNFDEDKLLHLAEAYLGKVSEGKRAHFSPFANFQNEGKYNIKIKETEQSHFCIGFYSYPREDERKFPLLVASTVLGGNMSSRLFNEVRENRGLVYDIRSQVKSFYDTGAVIISAGLRPENLIECLKVIKEQIDNISCNTIAEEELERAREYLVSQFLMGLEDPMEYMLWIGEQKATRDRMISIKDVVKKVRSVTVEDVKNICNDVFNKAPFFAMVGPEDKKEEISKILEGDR
ncbi:MAG: insulinase family protein [Candidatus Omnitrophica bacterium]|nr:insulinase family protein [Candidatus Omnitrophota bacterium]MCM8789033.1 insulinase family protein [Candidatus Omnitrophota bacterium]